jgi:Leucine-rich repeat (LRR) protein
MLYTIVVCIITLLLHHDILGSYHLRLETEPKPALQKCTHLKKKNGAEEFILDLQAQNLCNIDVTSLTLFAYEASENTLIPLEKLKHVEIDLSNNNLVHFPADIYSLTTLYKLNLSQNNIKELLGDNPALPCNLRVLHINKNKLEELPPDVCLFSLEFLSLRTNRIKTLSPCITNLTSLTTLDLEENQLQRLPEEFGCLTALVTLGLRNNKLDKLPSTIKKLTNLENLYVSNNQFEELPDTLRFLTKLTRLEVRDNKLRKAKYGFLALLEVPLSQLQHFDLSFNGLNTIPPVIQALTSLTHLDLSDDTKHIVLLPQEIILCTSKKLVLESILDQRSISSVEGVTNMVYKVPPAEPPAQKEPEKATLCSLI